ncbi:MAG TPA: hypothetical protein VIS74_06595 [Chthoniobacterales bacterium]
MNRINRGEPDGGEVAAGIAAELKNALRNYTDAKGKGHPGTALLAAYPSLATRFGSTSRNGLSARKKGSKNLRDFSGALVCLNKKHMAFISPESNNQNQIMRLTA